MELLPENINVALNDYFHELTLSHANNSEAPLHIAIDTGMRKVFLRLGVLDEQSNHEIVEMSYHKKKRQVK